jgi:hypothetical protein
MQKAREGMRSCLGRWNKVFNKKEPEEKVMGLLEKVEVIVVGLPIEIRRIVRNKIIAWADKLKDQKYKEEGGVATRHRLTNERAGSKLDWEHRRDGLIKSLQENLKDKK